MNERTKNFLLFGGGLAMGAALPVVVPALVEGGRPLAKALAKHGVRGFAQLRVAAARAAESFEDFAAEIKSELNEPAKAAAAAAESGVSKISEVAAAVDKKVLS
jgi:hypothetical protein